MRKCLKLCILLLGATLIFGCATQKSSEASGARSSSAKHFHPAASSRAVAERSHKAGKSVVKKAKTAIGTPYVLGGTEPGGFDCSGLVKWAYNSIGVKLPRTAKEQSTVGQKIKKVEDMRAGDIVAFRHPKRGYHTGIYVGDGKFIHSPRKKTRVRINSLDDPYFSSTLLGARRVNVSGSTNVVAEAESRMEEFFARKGQLTISTKRAQASNSRAAALKKESKKAAVKKAEKKSREKAAKKEAAKKGKKVAESSSKTKKKDKSLQSGKSAKKNARTVAHNNKAKTSSVSRQSAKAKKNSTHAVSMLQKKSKQTAHSRRHS